MSLILLKMHCGVLSTPGIHGVNRMDYQTLELYQPQVTLCSTTTNYVTFTSQSTSEICHWKVRAAFLSYTWLLVRTKWVSMVKYICWYQWPIVYGSQVVHFPSSLWQTQCPVLVWLLNNILKWSRMILLYNFALFHHAKQEGKEAKATHVSGLFKSSGFHEHKFKH